SPLHAAVGAGIAALQGVKHGGQTGRVEAFFREAEGASGVRRAVGAYLKRGESIPGFGHPLYPEGDPRGKALLELTAELLPASPAVALGLAARDAMLAATGEHPTIDLALVTLTSALGLPRVSALTLFALGRTLGWIGHAREQYALDRLIRPRARYTGPPPDEAPPAA
ncbi:MAG TPA: citrate/2-methylcitrate synthase, partial [Armatimonadota bacterium]|nr:citrate/2-methylcitrate synthase [Armatimonadota bacterium]